MCKLLMAALAVALTLQANAGSSPVIPGPFLEAETMTWKVNEFGVARWKTLVGGIEGGQIDAEDVQFGLWELAPHAIYHGHKHAAPEIYFILAGHAEWRVGDEIREVRAGTTIYTQPGQVHKMTNLTNEPVRAIWCWWAPGGDSNVFKSAYEFTEPAPVQRDGASFEQEAERLY